MLHIIANEEDYKFFEDLKSKYPDIAIVKSLNIDGSSHIVEIFIELSPAILSALTIIIHEILNYMSEKKKLNKKETTEIALEKKNKKGEYKLILKTSDIDNVDIILDKTIDKIRKL